MYTPTPALASAAIPNHSFEDFDDTTWQCDEKCTAGNAFDYQVYTSDKTRQPPDGIRYLYIFHEAGLYQNVTVPSAVDTLSFGYYNTEDDTGDEVYDGVFTITLTDVDSGEVYAQQTFSDQADNWEDGSIGVPVTAQGKTVKLYISNVTGFNRIDNFVFAAATDSFATVKVRALSAKNKPVNDAKVYIKVNKEKVDLLNLKTNATVTKVTTNTKGRASSFIILQTLTDNDTVKLCVKKKTIEECTKIAPAAGVETSLDFSFSNKTVKALKRILCVF
ncbi:MAG: hypothetical protein HYV33_03115 [Candidatus Kerfeldbacteria bacterium]|nr:hypothetical protein [Candidatus Kerfeldbacteria bacterium]